jgi:hypothetical protein
MDIDKIMNTKNFSIFFAIVIIVAVAGLSNFYTNNINAVENKFTAIMTGEQVVPPVDTAVVGTGTATFETDTNRISYQLNILDVCGITNIQMHYGERGQEGSLIVSLYQSKNGLNLFNDDKDDDLLNLDNNFGIDNNLKIDISSSSSSVQKSCSFSYSGGFSSTDLQGQFKDKTIDELTNAMTNNNIYVVVNSEQQPDGEIRGQILPTGAE